MSLYHDTSDLHHAAEKHPFGERMGSGTLSNQEWTDWLGALEQIHLVLDPYLPPCLKRTHDIHLDLMLMMPLVPQYSVEAQTIATQVEGGDLIGGLSYILSGANLRGGQVIRKALAARKLPCNHLTFEEDMAQAEAWLRKLRELTELKEEAQDAFQGLLRVMDEIHQNNPIEQVS